MTALILKDILTTSDKWMVVFIYALVLAFMGMCLICAPVDSLSRSIKRDNHYYEMRQRWSELIEQLTEESKNPKEGGRG